MSANAAVNIIASTVNRCRWVGRQAAENGRHLAHCHTAVATMVAASVVFCAANAIAIEPNVLCEISGPAGSTVSCPIRVAGANPSQDGAIALQLEFDFPQGLSLQSFTECEGCPVSFPPAISIDTGQIVSLSPDDPNDWPGTGTLLLLSFDPDAPPLSNAHMDNGLLVGDPVVLVANFVLGETVDAANPKLVVVTGAVASGTGAIPLITKTTDGIITTLLPPACPFNGAPCNDSDPCTTGDTCLAGYCIGIAVSCDDGDFCDGIDYCSGGSCAQGTPATCDDGLPCTANLCNPAAGCHFGTPTVCDDNDTCTIDSCNPVTGCTYTPDASVCDDGDVCTADVCGGPAGCSHTPLFCFDPTVPDDALCSLWGTAGSTVACPIRLARKDAATSLPVSTQIGLILPSNTALAHFTECDGCLPTFPPATTLSSGHILSLSPINPSAWTTNGTILALHVGAPDTALLDGYYDGGTLNGEAMFVVANIQLTANVDAANPIYVRAGNITVARAGAVPMMASVNGDKVIVVSDNTVTCATPGAPCNDNNLCTTSDLCVAGVCAGQPVNCNDGDFCNGIEVCVPSSGCLSGPVPDCNDGDLCTTELCDDDIGCLPSGIVDCDDNNTCTTDTCNPATGCQNNQIAGLCDDGDVCTSEICEAPGKCVYTPLFCYDPTVPANTVCSLSGTSGATVPCIVRLARGAMAQSAASSVQLSLTFDPAEAEITHFTACEACPAPVPPSPLPHGQIVGLNPPTLDAWSGSGTILALPLSGETDPLTDAWMTGPTVNGDATLFVAWFTLASDILPSAPLHVVANDILAANSTASPMSVEVIDTIIVTNPYTVVCEDSGVPCDDGDACTSGDLCIGGLCVGAPITCDDGDFCNGLESCYAATGCESQPVPNCDDGDACTNDGCDPVLGCVSLPTVVCDDNNACTADSCDSAIGCVYDDISATCVDGDACTDDICVPSVGCEYVPLFCYDPTYDQNTLCELSGLAGETVTCPLRLARRDFSEDNAAALQLTLSYGNGATLSYLTRCDGCPGTIPPLNTLVNGHTVGFAPPNLASWSGTGTFAIVNLTNPDDAITSAYMDGGAIQGDPVFVIAHFTLVENVALDNAIAVVGSGILATGPGAYPLDASIEDGVILTGEYPVSCAASGMPCDDGNACTSGDICVTGFCVGQQIECDDGLFCNGLELCDSLAGCVSGPSPNCADSDPCTTESCDDLTGCFVSGATDCDDNDACTTDTCNPAVGCINNPGLSCDDGNDCTADSCHPVQGCIHQPLACYDPNDTDVICKLSGSAGSVQECLIRIAKRTVDQESASSIQMTLSYPNTATLSMFKECSGCAFPTPPAPLSTGHTVALSPSTPGAWSGSGNLLSLDFSGSDSPLTTGYVDGLTTVGDVEYLVGFFTLEQDVAPETPVFVKATNVIATGAQAVPLKATVENNLIVTDAYTTLCAENGSACDDLDLCTTNDTCVAGVCVGTTTSCDDGDFCNGIEFCLPSLGCQAGPSPDCEDGNQCTIDTCDSAGACDSSTVVICNDNDLCTDDTCDPLAGCTYPPHSCDDGDPCTQEECNSATGCIYAPEFCYNVTENVLCQISGNAGSTAVCLLKLARRQQPEPNASALQLSLAYPPSLTAQKLTACETCVPTYPPSVALPSGHLLLMAPGTPSNWSGAATLAMLNFGTPTAPITDAYEIPGGIDGDPVFLALTFVLSADIDPSKPAPVVATSVVASGPGAVPLIVEVEDSTIFTGVPAVFCDTPGAACDDGDTCTESDKCVSGYCVGTEVVCGDGDFCTGIDTCISDIGCVSGPAPDCEDGNICTVPTCDSFFGCLPNVPLDCNDGNPCTNDVCVPGTGCVYFDNLFTCDHGDPCVALAFCIDGICTPTGIVTSCNDNNACTLDSCESGVGCKNEGLVCVDNIACTTDSCSPTFGCQYTPNNSVCNDNNVCTSDTCNVNSGCIYAATPGPCTDGNVCTLSDQCVAGNCVGTQDPTIGTLCDAGDADLCEDGRLDCVSAITGIECVNTGPVALWEFDVLSTQIIDGSGTGNNAAAVPPATLSASGYQGGALKLSGFGGYLSSTANIPESNFTLTAYIKTATNGGIMMASAGTPLGVGGYDRTLNVTGGKLSYSVATAGGTATCSGQGPVVADDAWHHVALSCGSVDGCKLYVDGSEICASDPGDGDSLLTTQGYFVVGFTGNGGVFNGLIDQIALYEFALDSADILDLYSSGIVDEIHGRNFEFCDDSDNDCDESFDEGCACLFKGDVTGDGMTNVVDAQCTSLLALYFLVGDTGPLPACLIGPTTIGDLNCDTNLNVIDVQLVIYYALKLPVAPDANGNNCVDSCELYDCGNGICESYEYCSFCPSDCGICP
ncbi:MAG: hypothetical protein HUU55_01225 [Myxococcales bacterium]|nr:hypothetical protein [Myxococcales bacterium]